MQSSPSVPGSGLATATILAVVVLATCRIDAQTLLGTYAGQNGSDALGTQVEVHPEHWYGGTWVPGVRVILVGEPGWNGARGRVEVVERNGTRYPYGQGTAVNDRYGAAISFRGDLNGNGTIRDGVVGAPGAGGGAGAVTAYSGASSTAGGTQIWTVSGAAGDALGASVAVVGDLDGDGCDDVVAGAPNANYTSPFTTYTDCGRVYVYSGCTGSVIRYHAGSQNSQHLGWAVASVGDVDGDGVPEYAAGAPEADVNGFTDAGRVFVYSGATGAWLAALTVNGIANGMRLGMAVAGAGDIDGDGHADYLVGAPYYDTSAIPNRGRFELHSGADGSLMVAGNGSLLARKGYALAGGTDLDHDGVPDFLVGAPGMSSGAGAVEIWSGRTLSVETTIAGTAGEGLGSALSVVVDGSYARTEFAAGAPSAGSSAGRAAWYDATIDWLLPAPFSSYGSSVAVLGDTDQDGFDDLAIGRYRYQGVIYSNSTWQVRSGRTSLVRYEETGPAPKGHTFAGLGDVDSDGRPDLAVGDPAARVVTIRSGASPSTILQTIQVGNSVAFGHSLTDAGDTDGDGVSDLLVGDPDQFFTVGIGVTGRATLVSGATGVVIRHHSGVAAGAKAGWSVAGLGDVDGDGRSDYAVGMPGAPGTAGFASGLARVYSGATGAVLFTVLGESSHSGHAGWSVCGPGDLDHDGFADLAVGEPDWNSAAGLAAGRVRIVRGGPGSAHPVLLTYAGALPGHHAGYAVAPVGDVDRDGTPDLGVSRFDAAVASGEVYVISGQTGADLLPSTNHPCWATSGEVLSGRRDPGPDGRSELLVGSPSLSAGAGAACLLELPFARAWALGQGCGPSAPPEPTLYMTVPKLGYLVSINLTNSPPGASPATLYMSAPPAQNLDLGFGCTAYLDLATMVPLTTFPAAPFAQLQIWIPDYPPLAGLRLRFQALMAYNPGPYGIALSRALEATIGF